MRCILPLAPVPLALVPFALIFAALPAQADEKTYMIAGFDRIRVEGAFTVRVTTDGGARARAVGDARALDGVAVRVNGRTLLVTSAPSAFDDPVRDRVAPVVEVRVPSLRSASVIGGGDLTVDRMAAPRVDISLSGPGSVKVAAVAADRLDAMLVGNGSLTLGGVARDAHVQSNGAGSVDASALDASTLTVNAQGAGDGRYAARYTADISAVGHGAITVAGTAKCAVRGTASVRCGQASPAR